MARVTVDQARAVSLAAKVHEGEAAKDALSRIVRPLVVSEARFWSAKFPAIGRGEIESVIAEKTLKGILGWRNGAGMSVTSYLKRCARNAVYDLARNSKRDQDTVAYGEDALIELVADTGHAGQAEATKRAVTAAAQSAYRGLCRRRGEIEEGRLSDTTLVLVSRLAHRLPSLAPYLLKREKYADDLASELAKLYLAVAVWMAENPGQNVQNRAAKALGLNQRAVSTIAKDMVPPGKSRNRYLP